MDNTPAEKQQAHEINVIRCRLFADCVLQSLCRSDNTTKAIETVDAVLAAFDKKLAHHG